MSTKTLLGTAGLGCWLLAAGCGSGDSLESTNDSELQHESGRAQPGSDVCGTPFLGVGLFPADLPQSVPTDVSADGTTVTGYAAFRDTVQAFRSSAGEIHTLGLFEGASTFGAGISGDGSLIVGYTVDSSHPPGDVAFIWEAGVITPLGQLPSDIPPEGQLSAALEVSANGRVVVGVSSSDTAIREAFRWTARRGLEALGTAGARQSYATSVSRNGSVIVGDLFDPGTTLTEAFVWRRGRGMVPLPPPEGSLLSGASGVSDDGRVIAGRIDEYPALWTRRDGWVQLGTEPGYAEAASADGSVVVGTTYGLGTDALIWDEENGARSLEAVLDDAGVLPSGWDLYQATGVSANGRVVVGTGQNPQGYTEGFVACVPAT